MSTGKCVRAQNALILVTQQDESSVARGAARGVEVLCYRVSLATRDWGDVRSPRQGALAATGKCFELIRGRSERCLGCPLPRIGSSGDRAFGLLDGEDGSYELVSARREGDVADVQRVRLSEDVVSALCGEKLRRLAQRALLSPREASVLELMVSGAPIKQIASVLAISARTAKFHSANLLRKLGAGSRLTLLRVVLDVPAEGAVAAGRPALRGRQDAPRMRSPAAPKSPRRKPATRPASRSTRVARGRVSSRRKTGR